MGRERETEDKAVESNARWFALLCFRKTRERETDAGNARQSSHGARAGERERGESRLEASSHAQRTRRRTAQTLRKDKDEPRVRLPLQAFAYWRLWRGKVLLASPLRGRDLPGVLH